MRKREEIERVLRETLNVPASKLILEVLLDIRELLEDLSR